ncbi:MAG: hypothetical protein LBC42_00320 [Puniceicoccales bacterium]|jgi:hypothetical protein|nr:hypothetical protein [Puniceicoccales bacterium]
MIYEKAYFIVIRDVKFFLFFLASAEYVCANSAMSNVSNDGNQHIANREIGVANNQPARTPSIFCRIIITFFRGVKGVLIQIWCGTKRINPRLWVLIIPAGVALFGLIPMPASIVIAIVFLIFLYWFGRDRDRQTVEAVAQDVANDIAASLFDDDGLFGDSMAPLGNFALPEPTPPFLDGVNFGDDFLNPILFAAGAPSADAPPKDDGTGPDGGSSEEISNFLEGLTRDAVANLFLETFLAPDLGGSERRPLPIAHLRPSEVPSTKLEVSGTESRAEMDALQDITPHPLQKPAALDSFTAKPTVPSAAESPAVAAAVEVACGAIAGNVGDIPKIFTLGNSLSSLQRSERAVPVGDADAWDSGSLGTVGGDFVQKRTALDSFTAITRPQGPVTNTAQAWAACVSLDVTLPPSRAVCVLSHAFTTVNMPPVLDSDSRPNAEDVAVMSAKKIADGVVLDPVEVAKLPPPPPHLPAQQRVGLLYESLHNKIRETHEVRIRFRNDTTRKSRIDAAKRSGTFLALPHKGRCIVNGICLGSLEEVPREIWEEARRLVFETPIPADVKIYGEWFPNVVEIRNLKRYCSSELFTSFSLRADFNMVVSPFPTLQILISGAINTLNCTSLAELTPPGSAVKRIEIPSVGELQIEGPLFQDNWDIHIDKCELVFDPQLNEPTIIYLDRPLVIAQSAKVTISASAESFSASSPSQPFCAPRQALLQRTQFDSSVYEWTFKQPRVTFQDCKFPQVASPARHGTLLLHTPILQVKSLPAKFAKPIPSPPTSPATPEAEPPEPIALPAALGSPKIFCIGSPAGPEGALPAIAALSHAAGKIILISRYLGGYKIVDANLHFPDATEVQIDNPNLSKLDLSNCPKCNKIVFWACANEVEISAKSTKLNIYFNNKCDSRTTVGVQGPITVGLTKNAMTRVDFCFVGCQRRIIIASDAVIAHANFVMPQSFWASGDSACQVTLMGHIPASITVEGYASQKTPLPCMAFGMEGRTGVIIPETVCELPSGSFFTNTVKAHLPGNVRLENSQAVKRLDRAIVLKSDFFLHHMRNRNGDSCTDKHSILDWLKSCGYTEPESRERDSPTVTGRQTIPVMRKKRDGKK